MAVYEAILLLYVAYSPSCISCFPGSLFISQLQVSEPQSRGCHHWLPPNDCQCSRSRARVLCVCEQEPETGAKTRHPILEANTCDIVSPHKWQNQATSPRSQPL